MATRFFGNGLKKLLNGTAVVGTTTFKLMLLTDGYTFDPDHEFVSSVVANEVSASGYADGFGGAGRKTITLTLDYDSTNNDVQFTFDDQTWATFDDGSSTDTVGGAAIIVESGSDAASHLIAFIDFAADKAAAVDTFTVDAPALGGAGGTLSLAV